MKLLSVRKVLLRVSWLYSPISPTPHFPPRVGSIYYRVLGLGEETLNNRGERQGLLREGPHKVDNLWISRNRRVVTGHEPRSKGNTDSLCDLKPEY